MGAAQQALCAATERSASVFLLGYGATPFTQMPLGFGAALADMPDKSRACWASFSKGFCDNQGAPEVPGGGQCDVEAGEASRPMKSSSPAAWSTMRERERERKRESSRSRVCAAVHQGTIFALITEGPVSNVSGQIIFGSWPRVGPLQFLAV